MGKRMEFHPTLLQILLLSGIVSFATSSDLNSPLIIGSSCVLEAIDPNNGKFDQEASDACGKCFEGAGSDISAFRSCSEKYLTAMSSICATHLVNEDDNSFWRPVLTCFNSLVQEWDEGGQVQAMVSEWLGEIRQKWDKMWEDLIEASCLVESKTIEGNFDNEHLKKCNYCWAQVGNASSEAAMGIITNCTEQFLPKMVNCPGVLASKGEALAIAKMTDTQWGKKMGVCFRCKLHCRRND